MRDETNNIEPNDELIEANLRAHLKCELDPHLGGAARRFAQHLLDEDQSMKITPARAAAKPSGPKFGSIWPIGLIGAALAATLTIVSMRHTAPASHPTSSQPGVTPVDRVRASADLDFESQYQGLKELGDGTYARQYLQHRTNAISVVDPKTKTTKKYIIPHEETVFVGLNAH